MNTFCHFGSHWGYIWNMSEAKRRVCEYEVDQGVIGNP